MPVLIAVLAGRQSLPTSAALCCLLQQLGLKWVQMKPGHPQDLAFFFLVVILVWVSVRSENFQNFQKDPNTI